MFNYLMLNLVVMSILALVIYFLKPAKENAKNLFKLIGVLLVMTSIFDSIIIALGLVTYDTSKILGLYIGKAPVEDFAYAIVAAVLVPILWQKGAKNDRNW